MPTIVGFVPKSSRDIPKNISFPLGFSADGTFIDASSHGWPDECQLILLDDERDEISSLRGNGPILMVQHNSNEDNWGKQKSQLESLGWNPSRIDRYSRLNTFPFWREVLGLLGGQADSNEAAGFIKSMMDRYRTADLLHKLDSLCAWAMLLLVGTTTTPEYIDNKIGELIDAFPEKSEEHEALFLLYNKNNWNALFLLASNMANKLVNC